MFPADAPRSFDRRVPPAGVETYLVDRPGRKARFQFDAADQQLRAMSFEWSK